MKVLAPRAPGDVELRRGGVEAAQGRWGGRGGGGLLVDWVVEVH
jgi:hypothetical protein